MTITADVRQRAKIAAENLCRIAADLASAQEDVALLKRLSSAQDRVKRLTKEHDAAAKAAESARAAEREAADAARFAGIVDVAVRDATPEESVTRSSFHVTFTRTTHDPDVRTTVPATRTVIGFHAVPDDVFAFLIEKHPSRIPAKILNLAPDNPSVAFERYFFGLRRGFIAS